MESVDNTTSRNTAEYCSPETSRVYSGSSSEPPIANVLGMLLLYSAAMFTLPIGTYFGVQRLLSNEFGIQDFSNTFWSVLAAVIVVNLIIASYVVRAVNEEKSATRFKRD